MNIKSQEKLIRMLFESGDNPVVTTEEDRFHLEDCIQYATKPGIIVATIKGDSESGIQQLPIGAVDSFRFMKVMDENAIINQEKNNGRSYDSILKEYEGQKNQIIQQWKKANLRKLEEVKAKYGNKFLGMDIVENQKQIQHKEEDEEQVVDDDGDKSKKQSNSENDNNVHETEQLEEGFIQKLVNKFKDINQAIDNWSTEKQNSFLKKIADTLHSPLTKNTVKDFIKSCQDAKNDIDKSDGEITENNIIFKIHSPDHGDMNCQTMDFADKIGIESMKKAVGSAKYMVFVYDTENPKVQDGQECTLATIRNKISKSVKRVSRDIDGIITYEYTQDIKKVKQQKDKNETPDQTQDKEISDFENKQYKKSIKSNGGENGLANEGQDLENTGSYHTNGSQFEDIIRPITKIYYKDKTIWIDIDRNKYEKQQKKKNDELFT